MALTVIALLAVLDLLLFHVMLLYGKRSTYDFITSYRRHGPTNRAEVCMSYLLCQCFWTPNKVAAEAAVDKSTASSGWETTQAPSAAADSSARVEEAAAEGCEHGRATPAIELGSFCSCPVCTWGARNKGGSQHSGSKGSNRAEEIPRTLTKSEEHDLRALHWMQTGEALPPGELPPG